MRKRLVAAALSSVALAGLAIPSATAAAPTAAAPSAPTAPIHLTLPEPTGKHALGAASYALVDHSRPDPWQAGQPYRELMISVYYPTLHPTGHPLAHQLSPGVAAAFDAAAPDTFGVATGAADWAGTLTHSHLDAPVAPGRFPVVLYSPGAGDVRSWNTATVEDLASRGYIVVTIDHPFDGLAVQFPDQHVDASMILPAYLQARKEGTVPAFLQKVSDVRVADTRFVLDRLSTLPHGLPRAMDLNRIGMFGHSAGGFTAASTMAVDPRIKAGVDMDGTMEYSDGVPDGSHLSTVAEHGLTQPFLLLGSAGPGGSDHHSEASWAAFWKNDRGWKADVTLQDSKHASLTDAETLLPQLSGVLTPASLADAVGTIDPTRAVAANRALVASFFDRWLKGHDDHLLDGGPTTLPVTFVR